MSSPTTTMPMSESVRDVLFESGAFDPSTDPVDALVQMGAVPSGPPRKKPRVAKDGVKFDPRTGRAWCVTLWSEEDVARLNAFPQVVALVVGEETAPTTQKVHYQTYVRFSKMVRFSWWKNQFPTAHVELRKGTEQEAAEYCRKEARVLVDRGCQVDVPPTTDVTTHVMAMIDAGASLWQVRKAHPVFYFHQNRKIKEYEADVKCWKEGGLDFGELTDV